MQPKTLPPEVRDVASWHDVQLLDTQGEDLSTWEADFLESLIGQLRAGRYLSTKQRARLDIMLEEKVS